MPGKEPERTDQSVDRAGRRGSRQPRSASCKQQVSIPLHKHGGSSGAWHPGCTQGHSIPRGPWQAEPVPGSQKKGLTEGNLATLVH